MLLPPKLANEQVAPAFSFQVLRQLTGTLRTPPLPRPLHRPTKVVKARVLICPRNGFTDGYENLHPNLSCTTFVQDFKPAAPASPNSFKIINFCLRSGIAALVTIFLQYATQKYAVRPNSSPFARSSCVLSPSDLKNNCHDIITSWLSHCCREVAFDQEFPNCASHCLG